MILQFSFVNYFQISNKIQKSQNPLCQIVNRGTELEENILSGLYNKIINRKYLTNKKTAWFLLRDSDFAGIEQIINKIYFYVILTKKTIFKI